MKRRKQEREERKKGEQVRGGIEGKEGRKRKIEREKGEVKDRKKVGNE